MSHPRVVNVRKAVMWDVYAGRGRCPCGLRGGCQHASASRFGNPFTLAEHGPQAMRLYLDWLAAEPETWGPGSKTVDRARRELPGKVLGCWCAPGPCHAEVLARLADGESLGEIRSDMLKACGLAVQ